MWMKLLEDSEWLWDIATLFFGWAVIIVSIASMVGIIVWTLLGIKLLMGG